MTLYRTILTTAFLLFYVTWSAVAQSACSFDVESVLQRVTEDCANIGENEVCYGNRDITATPRINTVDFTFNAPGDIADVSNIRSLIVDPANVDEDTWGVAQMRLQVGSETGVRDVILTLFGQFDVANAVEQSNMIDMQVRSFEVNVRAQPSPSADVLETLPAGSLLTGVGRIDELTWIRVENPNTRVVGWVENIGLELINTAESVGLLPVQDPDAPYLGAMQAFYFENGTSDIGCDSVASDGLIVQTPDGEARISLLINEVAIELRGAPTDLDNETSGTAFIQANPNTGTGMSVDVVNGEAEVTSDGETQVVESGQQSRIPISVDLQPIGSPSQPETSTNATINIQPFTSTIQFPSNAGSGTNSSGNSTGTNVTIGGNGNGNGSSNTGGSGNGTGVDISTSSGSGNGSNTGGGSGSGSGSSSGINVEVDTSNPFENSTTDLSDTVDDITNSDDDAPADDTDFFTPGNILALTIAIIAALVVMIFLLSTIFRRSDD